MTLRVRVTERQDQKGSKEFTVDENADVIRFVRDALFAMGAVRPTFDLELLRTKEVSTQLKGKTLKSLGAKDGDVVRIIPRKPRKDEETGNVSITNCFEKVSSAPKRVQDCRAELEAMMYQLSDIKVTERHLGKGGFGDVWVGVIKKTGQRVAVKEILPTLTNISTEERELHTKHYWREVLIMATMKHPALMNIVGYTPFVHSDTNRPALLMPVMKCSAQDMVDQEKAGKAVNWDLSQKHIVIYGIAAGMAFLHKNRVIHRDLKPSNVLLDDKLYPHITDFGTGKFVKEGQTQQQSCVAGTPLYMAPEALIEDDYSPKVDVYSFGLTAFTILSGNEPFHVRNQWQMMRIAENCQRPSLSTVPEQYHKLIQACWSRNPTERPDFKHIVKELGEERYLLGVDVEKFKEYQAKVVPETLAPETSKKVVLESIQRRAGQGPPQSSTFVLKVSAESGDVDSMYRMAVRLSTGDGVAKDEAGAFKWFNQAFQKGYKNAAFDLAMCYLNGRGTEQNRSKAIELLEVAVKDGNVSAMYELGRCHFWGLYGLARNELEGAKLFKRGSEGQFCSGDCESMYGYCLETGKGCKHDAGKALEYYRRSSDHGSPRGMFHYADMFHHGCKVPEDIPQACQLYWLAAKAGYHNAFYALFEIYHQGLGPVKRNKDLCVRAAYQGMQVENFRCTIAYCDLVQEGWTTEDSQGQCSALRARFESPEFQVEQNNFGCALESGTGCSKDRERAKKYLTMAGNNGNAMALSNLGAMMLEDGKVAEGIACLTKSAEQGCATAAIRLAEVLVMAGQGQKAFPHAEAAAKTGHIDAYVILGHLYMKGQGCKKDQAEGFSWYKKAADRDHPKGMYKAGCCYLKGKGTRKDENQGRRLLQKARDEAEEEIARKARQKLGQ